MQFTGSIKISELDPITSSIDEDFIPIVISSSMTTYRIDKGYFIPPPLQYVSGSNYSSWSYCSTQSLYASQSAWATQSLWAISASWASASISSSYAKTASWAINSISSISASWASASISSSYALSASWAPSSTQESCSWASASISASWAPNNPNDTLPIGSVIAIAYNTPIPNNYLECNGQILLTSSFLDLYNALAGSTTTTEFGYKCNSIGVLDASGVYFRVPDLRGEFIRGWDNGRNIDVARVFGNTQADSVIAHTHDVPITTDVSPGGSAGSYVHSTNGIGGAGTLTITSTANGSATETRPKNVSLMYIIKYSNAYNFANLTAYTLAGDCVGQLNTTVVQRIQGTPVSVTVPTSGQVLGYNGSVWIPTSAASSTPTGMVAPFAMQTAPSGWLECTGAMVQVSSYNDLATAIWVGTGLNPTAIYGYRANSTGVTRSDSGTHIKLPDLRGVFVRGWSHGSSTDSGRTWASFQDQDAKTPAITSTPHRHSFTYNQGSIIATYGTMEGGAERALVQNGTTVNSAYATITVPASGTETRPLNYAFLYCIKT